MADLEGLTDAQLRTKLVEYGLPVMPITGTTRKIMIKKLRMLIDTQKKSNAKERRTLAKYSSDDDSDLERKTQKRRATVASAAPVATATTTNKRTQNGAEQKKRNGVSTTSSMKSGRIVVEVRHMSNNDTSSDTEPELDVEAIDDDDAEVVFVEEEENSLGISLNNVSSFSTASHSTPMSDGSPPKRFTSSFRSSIQRPEPIIPTTGATSRYSAFTSTHTSTTPATPDPDALRSRHTYGYLAKARESSVTNEDTPYLSNFSKRLSTLTAAKPARREKRESNGGNGGNTGNQQGNKRNVGNQGNQGKRNNNGNGFFTRSKQKITTYFRGQPSKTSIRMEKLYKSFTAGASMSDQKNGGGNFISLFLVAAVGVFFFVLLALYYGMHHGSNTNDIIGLSVPYCSETMTQNCLTMQEAQGGIDLYKILKPQLIELAIGYQCGDTGSTGKTKQFMTDNDIVDFIQVRYKLQDEEVIINDIDSFVLIAYRNHFLGVSILKVNKHDGNDYVVMDTMSKANKQLGDANNGKDQYVRAFAVLSPTLPWKCSFWQKATALAKIAATILIIAGVLYMGKVAYRWFRFYQHQRKEQIVLLVEKIVELMQTQSDDEQFLVINHVRDMIIPIDSRKKIEYAWSEALKFIDENESRIRTEVQIVKGETYEVWRWIGGANMSTNANLSANKSWQGQAFEVQAGSVNSPPCSPTPCLKVRGMIDDADRNSNKTTIREAILAKCGGQCRVLHVAVDVTSKCVYLKCADTNDAAIAYRNLHGQWFAGHLVTVKYLRLERYMQRFPESPQSGPPYLKALKVF